jgi:hypothetical protein
MSVMMIRAKVQSEQAEQVEAAVGKVFSAIEAAQPDGVRYASCRLPDGVTFVIFLELDEGTENPLAALAEFRDFQAGLAGWLAEPPVQEQLSVVGSYRLF